MREILLEIFRGDLLSKRLLTILSTVLLCMITTQAQRVIDLKGLWQFGTGDAEHYDDQVQLPGSMLTNDKGEDVDIHTQWTSSLYDSSYYYNPYMEPYR